MRETFQEGHEIVVFKIRKAGTFIGLGLMSILSVSNIGRYSLTNLCHYIIVLLMERKTNKTMGDGLVYE